MADEIINRVANSALITFDLEEFYPAGPRMQLDISTWLFEGIVLREKEFRAFVKEHNWEQYRNAYLSVNCTTDAIVPAYAYLLITLEASPYANKVVMGTPQELETVIFTELIQNMDLSEFKDKPVIIKGCAHKPIPENAYLLLAQKLRPFAKSIMYGEACSSVPLYKKPKQV